jgi:hypothetical protein
MRLSSLRLKRAGGYLSGESFGKVAGGGRAGDGGFPREGGALPVLRFIANRAHPAKSTIGFSGEACGRSDAMCRLPG